MKEYSIIDFFIIVGVLFAILFMLNDVRSLLKENTDAVNYVTGQLEEIQNSLLDLLEK